MWNRPVHQTIRQIKTHSMHIQIRVRAIYVAHVNVLDYGAKQATLIRAI